MARKLVLLVAVVGLLAMAQAMPGLAATYNLESDSYDWVKRFQFLVLTIIRLGQKEVNL